MGGQKARAYLKKSQARLESQTPTAIQAVAGRRYELFSDRLLWQSHPAYTMNFK